jgi:glucose-1-phosphate thymidylyltransferase
MIPVANCPILGHVIGAVVKSGIRDIVVVVGYRKEQVIRYLSELPFEVRVAVQERQLGTAHAIRAGGRYIHDDFVVLPGDNYIDADAIRRVSGTPYAMLVRNHLTPSNFGVVTLKRGYVTSIVEKPARAPSMTVSTGIMALPQDALAGLRQNDLTTEIDGWIESGIKIKGVIAECWQDAIYPWDLLRMNEALLGMTVPQKAGQIDRTAVIRGAVSIGADTVIGPYTVVTGPVVIGDGCVIGPHACIGPGVSIGSRTVIEPFCRLTNSIVMEDVEIGSHSVIESSVIGSGVVLGDHTTATTMEGVVDIGGELIRTSFGLIAGDQAESGPAMGYQNSVVGTNAILDGHRLVRSSVIPDESRVI